MGEGGCEKKRGGCWREENVLIGEKNMCKCTDTTVEAAVTAAVGKSFQKKDSVGLFWLGVL